jgi:hypothetical protein
VPLVANPLDTFAGTISVEKIFNRADLRLTASAIRTEFENGPAQSNFNSRTFTERGGVWLSPLFYAYSDGAIGTVVTDATPAVPSNSTTSYRVVGGIGTRQFALYRLSAYYGHQGSQSNSATAGGEVYGGTVSYYATRNLTFTGTLDRTTNISSSKNAVSNFSLTLPEFLPVQVALSSSTRITSLSLSSAYEITRQWFFNGLLGYSRIESIGSTRVDNSWVLDTTLRYDIWRNLSLTWDYRYSAVRSNVPFSSPSSNFVMTGATYRF